jgi:hypothetical protein
MRGSNKFRETIDTLIAINFIKPRPPLHHQLKFNVPIMFLLPNPSRTSTEVEANLLYVDDVQVLSEQDDDEGDDANLHHDVGEGANCTKRKSTMTMKPVSSMKIKDGHGCIIE